MKKYIVLLFIFIGSITGLFGQADPSVQLPADENLALVRAHCTACHSAKLITQNRGDKQEWLRLIRWMQKTQGLWPIPPEAEKKIIDYLVKYYPPTPNLRRKPLPATQLPPAGQPQRPLKKP